MKYVLQRVKKERNILHTIKKKKANCIAHILCRNFLLEHAIEGKRGKDRTDKTTRKKTQAATGWP
jgi:hypothetical protein